jgi:hypothetical protein
VLGLDAMRCEHRDRAVIANAFDGGENIGPIEVYDGASAPNRDENTAENSLNLWSLTLPR